MHLTRWSFGVKKKLRSCDTIHENDIKANKVNKNARKKAILVISVFVFNFNIISMTENEHKKNEKKNRFPLKSNTDDVTCTQ